MPPSYNPAMPVTINDLDNLPHRDCQRVLVAERDDLKLQVIRWGEGYDIHAAVKQPSGGCYTILAAQRRTVEGARKLAREVWRKGKDFNVRMSP